MKREKLFFIGLMLLGVPVCFAAQEVQIKKVPKKPIPSTKPHAPAKMNVEAWVDGSCLTVTFLQAEGDASITFESTVSYSEDDKPNMPLYKYIFAPSNQSQCRGGEIKVGCKYNFAKVIVTMVTEFDGKRDTVITSRTYKPRFEWDPELLNKYGSSSMSTLQGYAASDKVLSTIDNGYYDRLLRENTSYNSVPKDSLEVKEIMLDEIQGSIDD